MLQRFFKANASDTSNYQFSIFSSKVHPSLWASLLWPPSLTPWPWMVGRDERLRSLVVGHVFDTPNLVNGAVAWRPSPVVLGGQMVKCNSIQHYMLYWFVLYDVCYIMWYENIMHGASGMMTMIITILIVMMIMIMIILFFCLLLSPLIW